jgi:hypothetical protein
MATIIKTISLTEEEVTFCEVNEISLTQLIKEAIHNTMRQQNSQLVINLKKKIENQGIVIGRYIKRIQEYEERLEKTDKLFEEVKGGVK